MYLPIKTNKTTTIATKILKHSIKRHINTYTLFCEQLVIANNWKKNILRGKYPVSVQFNLCGNINKLCKF